MIRQKLALIFTSCTIAVAGFGGSQTASAAYDTTVDASKDAAALAAQDSSIFSAKDIVIIDPQPQEVLRKSIYFSDNYVQDRSGDPAMLTSADFDTYASTKKGFLLNLYSFIGVLPPVYQEGYKPGEVDQHIAQSPRNSAEWMRLRKLKAEKNMQARLQALINAGYLKPEEINDAMASKQFVAEILYRVFNEQRPYKDSVAPLDSQNVSVRWAVEFGLPGFTQYAEGMIKPADILASDNVNASPYRELFDFLRLYVRSKKTENGWEYYQLKYVSTAQQNPGDAEKFSQYISQKRKDVMLPRIADWRRDLVYNPAFQSVIDGYRITKSDQALSEVYQAVTQQYQLFPMQNSPQVIKNVLDKIR